MEKRSNIAGITLTELLIVIGIAGILMAIGIPSFKYVTTANRIASEVNGLLGDMQYARAEAIKEGQTVTVCVSSNGTSCTNTTAWNGGWIVFQDPNANAQVDGGESVLRVQTPFAGSDTLTGATLQAVTFNREGFALNLAGTSLISAHDSTATQAYTRCLAVSLVGQLSTLTYGNSINGSPGCS